MPPIDKIYQDVQLNIDFSKEIAGASALPNTTLYSNLIPSETASSGTNTNNIAVSFAKLYKWAEAILTFTPGDTTKVSINPSAYSDTTYSFREYDTENPTSGAFQVRATGETWQTIAVHNVATLDSSGKVPQSQLPSYVDDVIEAYYYNGEFYKEAAHTNVIDNPREPGKIYVDISTSKSYRWGGTSYVEIKSSIDVFTGATAQSDGVAGIVPAPLIADRNKFLKGDGTWADIPTAITYNLSGAYGTGNKTWVSTLTANGSTAAGTSTVPTASTSVYGITSLSSATNSSAEDVAATPKAVKSAYDLAAGKSTVAVSNLKTSGTKIATITIDGTDKDVYVQNMTTSTASAAGTRGTVQAPANSMDKYLRGDNTWVEPVEDFRTKVNNNTFTLVLNCTNGNPSS